jgi:hypothetical protein
MLAANNGKGVRRRGCGYGSTECKPNCHDDIDKRGGVGSPFDSGTQKITAAPVGSDARPGGSQPPAAKAAQPPRLKAARMLLST